jgi:hypothetical protein
MSNLNHKGSVLAWIGTTSSIFILASIGPYPFGRPAIAHRLSVPDLLVSATLGALLGGLLGAAQSSFFRQWGRPSLRFIAYTSIGMAWASWSLASLVVVPILRSRVEVIAPPVNYVFGAFMAAALGISQGFALRWEGIHSRTWPLLSALGWFVAWAVCTTIPAALLADSSSPIWSPLAGPAFGLIYSSITAIEIFSPNRRQPYLNRPARVSHFMRY